MHYDVYSDEYKVSMYHWKQLPQFAGLTENEILAIIEHMITSVTPQIYVCDSQDARRLVAHNENFGATLNVAIDLDIEDKHDEIHVRTFKRHKVGLIDGRGNPPLRMVAAPRPSPYYRTKWCEGTCPLSCWTITLCYDCCYVLRHSRNCPI